MMNVYIALLLLFTPIYGQDYPDLNFGVDKWTELCPKLYPRVFVGFAPKGNESAGYFDKKVKINSLPECLEACCYDEKCNAVFMYGSTCFLIECSSNELCLPVLRTEPQFRQVNMILVSPIPPKSWSDYIDMNEEETVERNDAYATMHGCEIGADLTCRENEECVSLSAAASRIRYGVCNCREGFSRNSSGICVAIREKISESPETVSTQPTKVLIVSVLSKTVQLPEDEVTLSAFTVPAEQNGKPYIYNWKVVSQPPGSTNVGTMNDGMNSQTLKLSRLTEGVYTFSVTVTSTDGFGETTANVTVLPPKRINKPPVAVITPVSQTVKLPNTVAVLDGSTSTDDDQIISWHWDLQRGPLGYQPELEDSATLQLKNLKIPGNYTFKLTVEDSDHATNSTTANVTVVKVVDYPPNANAGQDVIVYLPQNSVTLNGNLSGDDRGIVSWEWTKSPSDQNKAVDMQKTRTPYLELSNLEEGMYTFVLKVTDDAGQSSSSEVHVFVKPPTNKPPTANAGPDTSASLPHNWVILNGSESSDDIKIVSYQWKQLSGPNKVSFNPPNASITNATDLTKGEYEFQLIVVDSNGNSATDSVSVTVYQNENAPPKANAGGDKTVVLPISVLILNGSESTDDLGIKKWEWSRGSSSRAMGEILNGSDKSPVLMMTNLVEGRYVFQLKVTDGQGSSDVDTVSVNVKPDPHALDLVELSLNLEASSLTNSQLQSLEGKLKLLLRDNHIIHFRNIMLEHNTGRAILVFYVGDSEGKVMMSGPEVVRHLKEKLQQDSALLELPIASIQTAICQNNCSAHGTCEQASRNCLCEAFWMQNLFRKYFGDGEANCDWSILYVIVVLLLSILFFAACNWGFYCLLKKSCMNPRKRQRYSLIDDGEENFIRSNTRDSRIIFLSSVLKGAAKSVIASESDSDSEVLFNRKDNKANGYLRKNLKQQNGILKVGRRIKT